MYLVSEMAPTVTAEQNRKYEKQILKTAKFNQNYQNHNQCLIVVT